MQLIETADPPHNHAVLHLWGPTGLTIRDKSVKLRRKGLALLYYLAVEGPTRRERIADQLWDQAGASQNLRVELHRLRAAVEPHGVHLFADNGRSLRLAEGVRFDRSHRPGTILEGLDDLASGFQAWLEHLRLAGPRSSDANPRVQIVDELAKQVAAPFVLVLVGNPGSGRRRVARELAVRLGLPMSEPMGSDCTLQYVVSEDAPIELADRIANDAKNVWVLERSAFGEDSDFLVKVRSMVAAERMRFVQLTPLAWWEAKQLLPSDMSFTEGARLYLASTGNPYYIKELLKLREQVEPGTDLPIPLTIRAKFALESRRLSTEARRAVERLAVHEGTVSSGQLENLGVARELAELEATGWLEFDGTSWRFRSELARRMLADLIPRGTRHQLEGAWIAALQNERSLGAGSGSGQMARSQEQRAFPQTPSKPKLGYVKVGAEALLDVPSLTGDSGLLDGAKVVFSRGGAARASSQATWELDEVPHLFRLRGRALVEDSFGDDVDDPEATIVVTMPGAPALDFHVAQVDAPGRYRDAVIRVPSTSFFEYWLLAPAGRLLRIESWARSAVIEMRLSAFHPAAIEPLATTAQGFVEAFILERTDNDTEAESMPTPDLTKIDAEQSIA